MTNKQPEMSVEEIVEEFYQHSVQSVPSLDDGQRASLKLKVKQIVQAERQKREEMVEAERERVTEYFLERLDVTEFRRLLNKSFTQPNNNK